MANQTVKFIMIEMAGHDTDSRVVTHLHPLSNFTVRATKIHGRHVLFKVSSAEV